MLKIKTPFKILENTHQKKIFSLHVSDLGLISQIYKELLKFDNIRITQLEKLAKIWAPQQRRDRDGEQASDKKRSALQVIGELWIITRHHHIPDDECPKHNTQCW